MKLAATLEGRTDCDRRRHTRQLVALGAIAEPSGALSASVCVTDLSTGGCGIETDLSLRPGQRLWITLSGFRWPCAVVWSGGKRAGLRFDFPMHMGLADCLLEDRSSELRDYVAGLLARFGTPTAPPAEGSGQV